jgi:hypothetical protein
MIEEYEGEFAMLGKNPRSLYQTYKALKESRTKSLTISTHTGDSLSLTTQDYGSHTIVLDDMEEVLWLRDQLVDLFPINGTLPAKSGEKHGD